MEGQILCLPDSNNISGWCVCIDFFLQGMGMGFHSKKTWIKYLILLLLVVSVAGCVRVQKLKPGSESVEFFLPATLVPTSLPPTPTMHATSPPAQSSGCVNNLSFISDVTIPDGTVVTAGSSMDKRWEVKNTGTCNWEEGYTLRLISGPEMGIAKEQALIPSRSGSQMVIRIVFTAPDEIGTHRSAWQAFDSEGNPFGDAFFIEVQVEQAGQGFTSTPE